MIKYIYIYLFNCFISLVYGFNLGNRSIKIRAIYLVSYIANEEENRQLRLSIDELKSLLEV